MNVIDHYVNGEKLYQLMMMPVAEKYGLTSMELTVLLFLENNPNYDTARDIVKYRHLTKSHVSMAIRSLFQKQLLTGEYEENNQKTVHLKKTTKADGILQDGLQVQNEFKISITAGFSKQEQSAIFDLTKRIDENILIQLKKWENMKKRNGCKS